MKSYFTLEWAKEMRDLHRKLVRIKEEQFNAAILKDGTINKELEFEVAFYKGLLEDDERRIANLEKEEIHNKCPYCPHSDHETSDRCEKCQCVGGH